MIQGTMSNAGKSLIAAGLCRIFRQDGYAVAPFKSQNMALNSYITGEGLEIGRAQAVQAEAAGLAPSAAMNPVLLKPTSDVGSQVIVNGEVVGNMDARTYFSYKKRLIPEILRAYETLAEQADVVVIEGAGSPAEINLRENDIVNMGLAELVDAPVLLVGDIDRGGVFAQLLGTQMLLTEAERARVRGFLINKFRGDVSLLAPGLRMLEERAGVPVAGVVPYLEIDIADEDGLSERLSRRYGRADGAVPLLDLAVIRVPHISNFTDFDVFERYEGVALRYVDSAGALGHPDAILLPGSKNTMGDLLWMRGNGLEAAVLKRAADTVVFGICGGFQMLGERIEDPLAVEGGGTLRGMGLLPVRTVLRERKVRTQTGGRFLPNTVCRELSGVEFFGYEIHMGESVRTQECCSLARLRDRVTGEEREDGAVSGNVCGTYVHGIFDGGVAEAFLAGLAARKGVAFHAGGTDDRTYRESQYDRLAAALREHLDMEFVYRLIS